MDGMKQKWKKKLKSSSGCKSGRHELQLPVTSDVKSWFYWVGMCGCVTGFIVAIKMLLIAGLVSLLFEIVKWLHGRISCLSIGMMDKGVAVSSSRFYAVPTMAK